jgi:hypothetical protein
LAGVYRDAAVEGRSAAIHRAGAIRAISVLDDAGVALIRNPNELLLLQGLLARLTEAADA